MKAEVVLVVRYGSETATVSVSGPIVAATGDGLTGELRDLVDRLSGRLVLDLTGVDECDPAGVARLVDVRLEADAAGVEMLVTGASDAVLDCLELSGYEALVPIG